MKAAICPRVTVAPGQKRSVSEPPGDARLGEAVDVFLVGRSSVIGEMVAPRSRKSERAGEEAGHLGSGHRGRGAEASRPTNGSDPG